MKKIKAQERFARPAPRYSEASLVKKLEELGIGRPSTYAPTITTIQKRQYVTTETREGKQRKIAEVTLIGSDITEEVKVEKTNMVNNLDLTASVMTWKGTKPTGSHNGTVSFTSGGML